MAAIYVNNQEQLFFMDTGDLTTKTYKAILSEAEKFHPNLTLQFGLLSYDCNNEAEFIKKSAAVYLTSFPICTASAFSNFSSTVGFFICSNINRSWNVLHFPARPLKCQVTFPTFSANRTIHLQYFEEHM